MNAYLTAADYAAAEQRTSRDLDPYAYERAEVEPDDNVTVSPSRGCCVEGPCGTHPWSITTARSVPDAA